MVHAQRAMVSFGGKPGWVSKYMPGKVLHHAVFFVFFSSSLLLAFVQCSEKVGLTGCMTGPQKTSSCQVLGKVVT